MLQIAGSILIALTTAAPDRPTDFDLFIRSFKQHFTDQRALLPLLGIGLLIAAIVGIDIIIGLRLARTARHAPGPRHHNTGRAANTEPTPDADEQTHSMLDQSFRS